MSPRRAPTPTPTPARWRYSANSPGHDGMFWSVRLDCALSGAVGRVKSQRAVAYDADRSVERERGKRDHVWGVWERGEADYQRGRCSRYVGVDAIEYSESSLLWECLVGKL